MRGTFVEGWKIFSWLLSDPLRPPRRGDALGIRAQHHDAEGPHLRTRSRRTRVRKSLSSLTIAVLAAGFVTPPASAEANAAAPALVINQDFADPDVLKIADGYLAYSTSNPSGRVPAARASTPGGPWTTVGDVLGGPPSWGKPDSGYWAPDVSQRADGSFLLYFSTTSIDAGHMCIGTAVSTAPTGPFQPTGAQPLVCVAEDLGDIDPQSFVDAAGTRFLLYKSNGSTTGSPAAIWLQRLSADGTQLTGGRTELLRSDLGAEQAIVEAPAIVERQSKFLLFYAADNFLNSGYHTSYAVSPTLSGAYVKADSPFLSTASLNGAVDGPGGADIVDDHIFFHGWLNAERKQRGLYVAPISFTDGVPHLS
jgi:arabinan endo-1,5-alpha-L-arabinosidase